MGTAEIEEWIGYYPEYGELLPGGRLRVRTSGRDATGEIWDGCIEVTPEDPRYSVWLERLRNKEESFKRQAEETSEARRQRREARRADDGQSRLGEKDL